MGRIVTQLYLHPKFFLLKKREKNLCPEFPSFLSFSGDAEVSQVSPVKRKKKLSSLVGLTKKWNGLALVGTPAVSPSPTTNK